MIYVKYLLTSVFIFIYSCDKDGTTIVNPPVEEESFANDLNGDGCSDNNLCYSLDNIYYDFSNSTAFEIDYYKFNAYQLQSGSHNADDPSNILKLKSFNDAYFIGIPISSIEDESNQVLVIDESGENYEFSEQDIIYQNLISQEVLDTTSFMDLSSSPFSVIKNITWNPQQGRYNFVTATSDKYYTNYKYSQDYDKNSYVTLIDTVLNPIFGDIILVDADEYVYRNFTTIDSLINGDEIKSFRSTEFKIKNTYISDDDAIMFRKSTDCNDNYKQDSEEEIIFSNYLKSDVDFGEFPYAKSFEGWCFTGACNDDDSSYNNRDCCENNGGMWYPTSMTCEPFCLSYSINCSIFETNDDCLQSPKCSWDEADEYCMSSITEQDCCEHQGENYEWNSELNTCSVNHDYWSERSSNIEWNDDYAIFDINVDNMCETSCTKGDTETTMNEYCRSQYLVDNRATAVCFEDDRVNSNGEFVNSIYNWQSTDVSYAMTFCDRGNNLHDTAEVFQDQNGDTFHGDNNNQGREPFEDRNCNSLRDLGESLNLVDCPEISAQLQLQGVSFCDQGNAQWDDEETCATGGDCGYDYLNLFTRSVAPDQLIVNYEDPNSPVPYGDETIPLLPQGNFFDTGEDGCFDIFETGDPENPCVCEFNDYHDEIGSCIDYLTDLDLMVDTNGNGFLDADLNMDDAVDEIDIALSYQYSEIDFGVNSTVYNYGKCINGYSGTKEDCCLHHGCTWDNSTCSYEDPLCELSTDNFWTVNLDPNDDNHKTEGDGKTEFDGLWQPRSSEVNGEQAKSYKNAEGDIIGHEVYFSSDEEGYQEYVHPADYAKTKILDYNDGYAVGGDIVPIIYNTFDVQYRETYVPIIKTISSIQSNEIIDQIDFDDSEDLSEIIDSEQFYNSILNNHHLVKTEFTNSEGVEDHDYLIYKDTDEHIVKMIHPYYHFLPGYYHPQNIDEFNPDDDFWQSVHMEPDTLLYSFNGNIIDGQSFHSMNSVYSDTANYNILKEYYVEKATASLKHSTLDPNCIYLEEEVCGNDDYYWCAWNESESTCYSNQVTIIPNCLLVTRIIKTTAIGPGMGYSLKSESYFKPGYGIVREDISIYWEDLPWVEIPWFSISSIQYKTPAATLMTNQTGGLLDYQLIDVEDLSNIQDFNYDPYKITNTLGVQRIEYPFGY